LQESEGLAFEALIAVWTEAPETCVVARHARSGIVHVESDSAFAGFVCIEVCIRLANRAAGREAVGARGARDVAGVAVSVEDIHVEPCIARAGVVAEQNCI
jgi:hypothetical protein